MGYGQVFSDGNVSKASYLYRPSQPVRRPVSNWTAPFTYRPNPYKWVNPSLRSCSDQYKADLQPVRSEPRPGPGYSTTYSGRPADRASQKERYRSADPAPLQLADRSERSSESRRYRERSQASRSKERSSPPKRFREDFIVLDEYSSESDTSLVTTSGSGSSIASSCGTGSNTSLSEISSSSSTVLYSTGSELSLDDESDCSLAKPAVEAGGHEPKETPELWGTHLSDDMERQLESWASEKPEDFVPVTPKLRGNSDKGLGQVTLSLIKKPQPVSMVTADRLSSPVATPKPSFCGQVKPSQFENHVPAELPELWGCYVSAAMQRQMDQWEREASSLNIKAPSSTGQIHLTKPGSASYPLMQSSVVAKQQVTWCAPKPCLQSSVVDRPVVMPTQPALQSSVSAWTTPVQRIIPGPSPATRWGPSSYPQSSVRCSVARKRPLEEYENEAAPSAKIHINKNHPSNPYRPSQPVRRHVSNWTAPSSYRPNPYKWVNPSLRSRSDQYKADLQPVRSEPKPGPSYSATYSGRPAVRESPKEGYRSEAPACLQQADRSEKSNESRYREKSQVSRSKERSPPPKRFRGDFIVWDEYSSESDTSLATSSGSVSSLASSCVSGSNISLCEMSSSSSTVLYSTGSESSLDDECDCSVAKPAVEAGGHEPKETPELWGTYLTDDMKRQLESWALEKPEDFVPVTPKLRGNSDKGLGQVTLSLIKKPQPVSMVTADRLSTQVVTPKPSFISQLKPPHMENHVPAELPELSGCYVSAAMQRQMDQWEREANSLNIKAPSSTGQIPLTKPGSASNPLMQSSVVAKQQVNWCAPKPCLQSSVVARPVVMPTQPALQSAVGAWTTPVHRIIPGPSPATRWGPNSYPQSSLRCSVARKRPLEEYENEAAPSAKIHINKNHPRFRHLFQ